MAMPSDEPEPAFSCDAQPKKPPELMGAADTQTTRACHDVDALR